MTAALSIRRGSDVPHPLVTPAPNLSPESHL